MGPDGLFVSQLTGSHSAGIHVPFTNCLVCRWFCVVHDPKAPLHSHNWLSFGKFQDTERFLIHCERHFSSRLPLSVEPGSTRRPLYKKKKKLGEILYLLVCSFLPCLSWLLRSRARKSRRDLWITLYSMSKCKMYNLILALHFFHVVFISFSYGQLFTSALWSQTSRPKVKATFRFSVSQSVSQSWCRALPGAHDQTFVCVLNITVYESWIELCDDNAGLSGPVSLYQSFILPFDLYS